MLDSLNKDNMLRISLTSKDTDRLGISMENNIYLRKHIYSIKFHKKYQVRRAWWL